jgi:hypothetical protein
LKNVRTEVPPLYFGEGLATGLPSRLRRSVFPLGVASQKNKNSTMCCKKKNSQKANEFVFCEFSFVVPA